MDTPKENVQCIGSIHLQIHEFVLSIRPVNSGGGGGSLGSGPAWQEIWEHFLSKPPLFEKATFVFFLT